MSSDLMVPVDKERNQENVDDKSDWWWGSDSRSGSVCQQWPLVHMNHSRPHNHYLGNNEDDKDKDLEAQHMQSHKGL